MTITLRTTVLIGYGFAFGYGAFCIWPFTPFRHTAKDWVDIASAIGTCAAAVIALWLGYLEIFRRNRADKRERKKAVEIAIVLARRALKMAEELPATLRLDLTERAIQNAVDVLRDRREAIDRINLYTLDDAEISAVEEIRTSMTKLISICNREDLTKLDSIEFHVIAIDRVCADVRKSIAKLEGSKSRS